MNNGNDTDINVYFKGGESYKTSDLAAIPIKGQSGIVRMSDVAELRDETGPITICVRTSSVLSSLVRIPAGRI